MDYFPILIYAIQGLKAKILPNFLEIGNMWSYKGFALASELLLFLKVVELHTPW